MNGTNAVVVVQIDRGGPVHISEVMSQVLPSYVQRQSFATRENSLTPVLRASER